MRVIAAILGVAAVLLVVAEFFAAYLLPRRVKRDPRVVRGVYDLVWRPWRSFAGRFSRATADTLLGLFGPLGLLAVLFLWILGLILGYAAIQWSVTGHGFGRALELSAGSFFTVGTTAHVPDVIGARLVNIIEAANGFIVIFVVIGYLPLIYSAFERREVAVSRLDARAGSPPSAGALLRFSAEHGGWPDIADYLHEWEEWAAELMETHLAYPILGFFRSQHVNQGWLAALTTVVDASAFALATSPERLVPAELTYAIGRHAFADLSHSYRARPGPEGAERIDFQTFCRLRDALGERGLELVDDPEDCWRRLTELRRGYEPRAIALARHLELPLPDWSTETEVEHNWREALRRPH